MEWVSIKDQQPKEGQNVIAVGTWFGEITGVGETEYVGIGAWNYNRVSIASDTYSADIVEVTHWMPLPSYPEL